MLLIAALLLIMLAAQGVMLTSLKDAKIRLIALFGLLTAVSILWSVNYTSVYMGALALATTFF